MKKFLYHSIILLLGGLFFTGCDDYLDETPDNRTEIDTPEKVNKLLVSAYSIALPIVFHEMMSDNMTDRGSKFDWDDGIIRDSYCFTDQLTSEGTDSPANIWENNYKAVAAANLALEAIQKGLAGDLSAQKGEALLCRAYAHFTLCNTFCQAYNPQSSATDLGIPYFYGVETNVFNTYERGTVADVYAKIAKDIEEGLPLIDDALYAQPKYHFNKAAANAFAAQFYLCYGKYKEAVECATEALGEEPSQKLRDLDKWNSFSSDKEMTAYWVDSQNNCNFFIQSLNSIAGRMFYYRPVLTSALLSETIRSKGAWGSTYLKYGEALYVNKSSSYISPKQAEFFVFTDAVQGIGYTYIVNVPYSTEKTLINRAEAYVMLEEYDKAAADLSLVYTGGGGKAEGASFISFYYEKKADAYNKAIAPRFTVAPGKQENMIHACLHIRRIVTIHEGTRILDLKRFGIAYTHEIINGTNVDIVPYDKRLAILIPASVVAAGMEQNPR